MTNRTYYIDPKAGKDTNSGLDESQARATCNNLALMPGDTVLFKRGSLIRGGLEACCGSELGDITYGAYGTGEKPVFSGSVPVDGEDLWIEEAPSVWRFTGTFSSEVCNLIFNGKTCGNLRWSKEDLKCQGEWYFTLLGCSTDEDKNKIVQEGVLYLFSSSNPGSCYKSVECALWGHRRLVWGKSHIVFENLVFQNSGVHGYQEFSPHHITIRNCEFHFIGGAVWSREKKIRFGNAVEFWDGAWDINVENCIFTNIYDSGVTHQGVDTEKLPERLYFRNNRFEACGMAAYECRGPAASEVYFENNTCINAGGEFAMQGEPPPRQSEIYPQPMGHHVFIWLIGKDTQKGKVYIRNNIFNEAPNGAAIYSIIDPGDEKQFVIENNCYRQKKGSILMRMNNKLYGPEEFEAYKAETGHDAQSIMEDLLLVDAE
jgi:hypothetical protein